MMLITSIVPRLPPAIDGVGDYALRLAQQWQQDLQWQNQFIIGDPAWMGDRAISTFPTHPLPARSAAALLAQLPEPSPQTVVLLHYVGYGYASRGCPVWLVDALTQWKKRHQQARLVTMFHELAATEPPWKSGFWLSPVQTHLVARLAQLSDRCLTSGQHYAHTLRHLSRGNHQHIPTLPIFSNVGELPHPHPLAKRHPHLVIFGQVQSKQRVYRTLATLKPLCHQLAIQEIWDIGPPTTIAPTHLDTIPIRHLGSRPSPEVSERLATAIAGVIHYDAQRLSKSGVFAAYCAHGMLPISLQPSTQAIDGLVAGQHYWQPAAGAGESSLSDTRLQAIANQAHAWYQTHTLAAQARTFATCLANGGTT